MNNRYLYKAKRKDNGEWAEGYVFDDGFENGRIFIGGLVIEKYHGTALDEWNVTGINFYEVDPSTICQCTGLRYNNKTEEFPNGKLIWENDILMCHGNRNDLVKAVFGEFFVINAETLEIIDSVIGWHYEVIPTDAMSRCEPFCLSMPLTEEYVQTCEFEVIGNIFDNPDLLDM